MTDKTIQDKIRKADKRQLLVLKVIANSITGIAYTSELKEPLYGAVSNSESTAEQTMGGVISSIVTMRGKDGALLLAMGRDGSNARWKLNESVINREELKDLIEELLTGW
jgi:hypothetical protein